MSEPKFIQIQDEYINLYDITRFTATKQQDSKPALEISMSDGKSISVAMTPETLQQLIKNAIFKRY